MSRPAGYAKFPLLVAAPVDLALFERLENWAQYKEVSKAQILRDLIAQLPDLQQRQRPQPQPTQASEE